MANQTDNKLDVCIANVTEILNVHRMMKETETQLTMLMFYVIPCFAFLGIIGNLVSIRILVHNGLKKSHNLMLVALACSDSSYLSAMFLYGITAKAGCQYFNDKKSLFFIFYNILLVMDLLGGWSSFMMTLFITIERLIVVYFPLKSKEIITPKNSLAAISCLYIFVFTWVIILMEESLSAEFIHFYNSCKNKTIQCPIDIKSLCAIHLAWFRNKVDHLDIFNNIPITSYIIYGPIPASLVVLGCIAIFFKLIRLQSKRVELTRKEESVLKPTATILMVCLVYTLCTTVIFLIHSKIVKSFYSDCGIEKLKLDVITVEVVNSAVLINCSLNFIIYVVTNSSYRQTFLILYEKEVTRCKIWRQSKSLVKRRGAVGTVQIPENEHPHPETVTDLTSNPLELEDSENAKEETIIGKISSHLRQVVSSASVNNVPVSLALVSSYIRPHRQSIPE